MPRSSIVIVSAHRRPPSQLAGDVDDGSCRQARSRMRVAAFSASSMRAVASPLSNPLNLNPQRMLLDLGHQQDFGLLLFSYLEGIRSGDALTLRVDGQGQGQSI